MPISSPVGNDANRLACRWILDPVLAQGLIDMDRYFANQFATAGIRWPGIWITSGYRSKARQAEVNPNAPDSLHTRCPSLAADVRVGSIPGISGTQGAEQLLRMMGGYWKLRGHRWGGDFQDNYDPIHFDLGRA